MTPNSAMILAAGKGTRMAPLTDTLPKPLVRLAGTPLIDHALARIEATGISKVIVNVHYLADLLEAHLTEKNHPQIIVSDERNALLETGGGVKKALAQLGEEAFYLLNSDSVWWEYGVPALTRMVDAWHDAAMDILLLLVPITRSIGYDGSGDLVLAPDGRLARLGGGDTKAALVYTGTAILHPRIFAGTPTGAFSLNMLFDRAIESGRLYGLVHDGFWMHVGTPQAINAAEARLRALGAEKDRSS